jgi:hypothetical protein
MAAKPRVHEIAHELNVDTKILLQTLKDMGEYVKGPSSTIQVPVARRLREAFTTNQQQSSSTPVVVRAIPAPPGTSSRVIAPLPLSFLAASAIFADVQDPPLVSRRLPSPAPAPRRTPTQAPPQVRESVVRHVPTVTARQPTPVSKKPRPQAPTPVRQKTIPQRVDHTSLARLERSTTPTRTLPPVGTAPGDAESWTRRSIVIRADREWFLYKFSSAERQRWISAGLKPDQAHIAAMCQTFRGRGLMLSPAGLSLQLSTGRTVLEEFNRGANAVEVLLLLAEARGVILEPEFDARLIKLLIEASEAVVEESLELPANTSAASVPRVADFLLNLIGTAQVLPVAESLNRERIVFENTGRAGALVKLYAQAHGVFGDSALIATLLENVPSHVAPPAPAGLFVDLVQKAVRDRKFYHVSNASAVRVMRIAHDQRAVPNIEDLPSASGFAILQDGSSPDQTSLLVWHHTGAALSAVIIPYTQIAAGIELRQDISTVAAGRLPGNSSDTAARVTTAVAVAIRLPFEGQQLKEKSDIHRLEKPRAASKSSTKHRDPAPIDDDFVVLVYAAGEVVDDSTYAREGHRAVTRWLVGGHYRRQPYRSTGSGFFDNRLFGNLFQRLFVLGILSHGA